MGKWSRCNCDGKAISPEDLAQLAKMREWLAMTDEERANAERHNREWRIWLGIERPEQ